jgi:hypothetical protein
MRRLGLLLAAACPLALAACGNASSTASKPPVRLSVDAPGDGAVDNVVDVMATAPSSRPAMTALRILREITIRVPDVTGDSANDARSRLEQAGLRANVHESGGLFEDLLPNDPSVCETTPAPGTRVARGSTVRVRTSKTC